MRTRFKAITWLGVRTEKFNEMVHFYENTLGLQSAHEDEGFRAYKLPNQDTLELFDASLSDYHHFTTGPVAGFLVDDIEQAKEEMEAEGIKFIGEIEGDPARSRWAHFRGPDDNIYELKWTPE
jgi:predicted enzyme related to lactoylglutathione lyase